MDEICENCNGGKGLHHYKNWACPIGGVEGNGTEFMEGVFYKPKKQRTIKECIEDLGNISTWNEYDAALNQIDRLKAQNKELYEACEAALSGMSWMFEPRPLVDIKQILEKALAKGKTHE